MSLMKHAIGLSSVLLLSPLAMVSVFGAEPTAPPWTADQLIEALEVQPEPEVTFEGRGIRRPQADEPAQDTDSGIVRDLKIVFDFDSAELTPEAQRALDQLALALADARLRDNRFRIAGHTDAVGGEAYNLELSRRRAEAVVDYLQRAHGLDRTRMVSQGFGKSQLLDPNSPTSSVNRRVEVVNLAREGG